MTNLCNHTVVSQDPPSGGRYRVFDEGKTKEILPYTSFRVIGYKPSVYAPGHTVRDDTESYTRCPSCKTALPLLKHGSYLKCGCGLKMQLFGNGLNLWK